MSTNGASSARRTLRLSPEALRRRCDPKTLPFRSTEEIEPHDGAVGQERALKAIEFGLDIDSHGYNVFATGPIGSGRHNTLQARLHEAAATRLTPGDVVYLPDFDAPGRPLCVVLPTGAAKPLAEAMRSFLADAKHRIPQAFDSDSYRRRRAEALGPLDHEREAALQQVKEFAQARGVDLELTPAGVVMVPLLDGKPVTPQQFGLLPDAAQAAFVSARESVAAEMSAVLERIREVDARAQQRVDELNREVVLFAVGHLIEEVKRRCGGVKAVADWLQKVREDVIDNYTRFLARPEQSLPAPLAAMAQRDGLSDRYAVNVFVSHDGEQGAPVVIERNPTFQSLFGRIEYVTTLGAAITDHNHVKAGAVHRASGGYLMLHAEEMFARPFLWEKLKQILRTGLAPVENLADQYVMFPTASLAPEPPTVTVKVVLVGGLMLHQLLYELDEDMRDLFRVRADFDVEMRWEPEHAQRYAAFIGAEVRAKGLRHFDAGAVAATIEHGARRAAHQQRLSTRLGEISDLVAQASYWAGKDGADLVGAEHVRRAIAERIARSSLLEQRIGDAIAEGTLRVDLHGRRVGVVNGLAVSTAGEYEFGHPVRVTASAAPGDGRVMSIERESKLSGHIHDKGFLGLRGFLAERYGKRLSLSVSASIAFEQSYGSIDGDSAASTELYALLSTLSGAPIDQQIAVTGSVDQHGAVQAIGAATEKVEGFFKVCSRSGLTGEQGVMIPAANVRHLMLDEDVVKAVEEGRFHVWAVESIEQGIELLTGVPAGGRRADGLYQEGTIHRMVEERLEEMASAIRALAGGDSEAQSASSPDGAAAEAAGGPESGGGLEPGDGGHEASGADPGPGGGGS